jgi:hypothetical protein
MVREVISPLKRQVFAHFSSGKRFGRQIIAISGNLFPQSG